MAQSHFKRVQEHDITLQEALSRLGVKEVMKVYQSLFKVDYGLISKRLATKVPHLIMATNSADP